MFVQNQISSLPNHQDIISAQTASSDEIIVFVAYVRENGVGVILEHIKNKHVKIQVLCSLDMGITQLSGIRKLLEKNVSVRVYTSHKGTFHPKVWLFKKNKKWNMLIGSANLTRAALIDNVEASLLTHDQTCINNARKFLGRLWGSENATPITIEDIKSLEAKYTERVAFHKRITIPNKDNNESLETLLAFVKNWVDIPKQSKQTKSVSHSWRGWYIIPDQGYINDQRMQDLLAYLLSIEDEVHIESDPKKQTEKYRELINRASYQRQTLKTSRHGLFVRQTKNYLLKLGWCAHPLKENGKPNKGILSVTELGRRIIQCHKNTAEVKTLYTEYFLHFSYNGLAITAFTKKLLDRLDYLTLKEFECFIVHAYTEDDLELMIKLVSMHRHLSETHQTSFYQKYKEYFDEKKESTAKDVYGNYQKKVKHTISVFGWCKDLSINWDTFTLSRKQT